MEPPARPNEEDCCNSGCNPCILDVYDAQLKKFNRRNVTEGTYENCISPTAYSIFKLVRKEKHTASSYILTFEFVRPRRGTIASDVRLRFNPGQCFMLRSPNERDQFTRAYTPLDADINRFRTLVRIYEGGAMSKLIERMTINQETLWRGPYGDFVFDAKYKHVLMIAQGVGVAPFYSIIKDRLDDDECEAFIKLFYCCRCKDEVALRDELYAMLNHWNFSYHIFISRGLKDERYNETVYDRRLRRDDVEGYVRDKVDVQVLICGSVAYSDSISTYLDEIGFDKNKIVVF